MLIAFLRYIKAEISGKIIHSLVGKLARQITRHLKSKTDPLAHSFSWCRIWNAIVFVVFVHWIHRMLASAVFLFLTFCTRSSPQSTEKSKSVLDKTHTRTNPQTELLFTLKQSLTLIWGFQLPLLFYIQKWRSNSV